MQMRGALNFALIISLIGWLAACASTGQNFDESKISQIKKGVTTEEELTQWFGQPQQRGVNSDGQTTLMWMYYEATVKGESFIPYAGPFVGGTNTRNKTLSVTLSNGKVSSYTYSGGGNESRNNIQSDPKKQQQK